MVKHPNGIPIPLDPTDPTGNSADPTGPFNLLLAPAERADVLIDFTGWAGKNLILYSDAPAPFPMGDPRNDYYTGDPDFTNANKNSYELSGGAKPTGALSGPNTRTIMRITVNAGSNGFIFSAFKRQALNFALKRNFKGGNFVAPQQDPLLYHEKGDVSEPGPVPLKSAFLPPGTVVRNLTLNEDFDEFGRLLQREGTTDNDDLTTMDELTKDGLNNQGLPTWGRGYLDTPTEVAGVGAVEVWNIFNRTGDTHPIHFHLVNVQVIQRALFKVKADGSSHFKIIPGTEVAPDANELGWKDTVRMNGVIQTNEDGSTLNGVTTVIAKFDLPKTPFAVPQSKRTGGYEYVWHCHILEHEEHDMMRPLVILDDLAINPPSAVIASLPGGKQTFKAKNAVLPLASVVASGLPASCTLTKDLENGTFTVVVPRNAHMPKPGVTVTFTVTDSSTRRIDQKTATAKLVITNLI
jgi:spore coat protein A